MPQPRLLARLLVVGLLLLSPSVAAQTAAPDKDLTSLSLEELMKVNVSVTSAARRAQRLGDVAGAVYVLTADDIRRSGARTIPDALRLVPGLQVAQIDANKWAVSARGFNSRFSNKLLVLMDGRTIYTPLFSGVVWDLNHFVPDDIDRIEVIRGPGASLWGSNAVNGIINIITKSAKETQGGLATLGAGTGDRGFGSFRWGGKAGESTHWRASVHGLARSALERNDGGATPPTGFGGTFGLRLDSQTGPDSWHLSAGHAGGTSGETPIRYSFTAPFKTPFSGRVKGYSAHVLGRWARTLSPMSDLQVQGYVSRETAQLHVLDAYAQTFDLELQHRFKLGERHQVVLGGGYRLRQTGLDGHGDFRFSPEDRTTGVFSAFIQDEYTLIPDLLRLTVGSRFEHHPFTGFNLQPNVRLAWTPSEQHTVWGAIARAVRTPSIGENDTTTGTVDIQTDRATGLPLVFLNRGPNGGVRSETVVALEAGYRVRPVPRLSLDVSSFYNVYQNLLGSNVGTGSFVAGPPPRIEVPVASNYSARGRTYGAELATEWQPGDALRLRTGYSLLRMDLESDERNAVIDAPRRNPRHQGFLHASYDAGASIRLDGILRGATRLTAASVGVPGYVTMDARIAWQPTERWELSLVGTNLIGPERVEFVPDLIGLVPTRVGPTFYAKASVRF